MKIWLTMAAVAIAGCGSAQTEVKHTVPPELLEKAKLVVLDKTEPAPSCVALGEVTAALYYGMVYDRDGAMERLRLVAARHGGNYVRLDEIKSRGYTAPKSQYIRGVAFSCPPA